MVPHMLIKCVIHQLLQQRSQSFISSHVIRLAHDQGVYSTAPCSLTWRGTFSTGVVYQSSECTASLLSGSLSAGVKQLHKRLYCTCTHDLGAVAVCSRTQIHDTSSSLSHQLRPSVEQRYQALCSSKSQLNLLICAAVTIARPELTGPRIHRKQTPQHSSCSLVHLAVSAFTQQLNKQGDRSLLHHRHLHAVIDRAQTPETSNRLLPSFLRPSCEQCHYTRHGFQCQSTNTCITSCQHF
mmetsp:Transcript_35372/g.42588  ORF Transcript_35372/g.42588 Transcript_35372/m.42588 type:complete len:239 (+) Transcript_35372:387-1103(+)